MISLKAAALEWAQSQCVEATHGRSQVNPLPPAAQLCYFLSSQLTLILQERNGLDETPYTVQIR